MNPVVRRGVRAAISKAGAIACGLGLLALAAAGNAVAGAPALLKAKCGDCHDEGQGLQRISNMRKSPEGWDMTIVRMGIWHKVNVSRDERKALVKYLADTQGLAPEETAAYRALIERQPNSADVIPSEELGVMCARCHSFGRVALQRRNADEWRKLAHTHVGQFPSIEYSAQGRDRNWFELATGEVATKLGELYPYRTDAWRKWQATKRKAPTGTWRVSGHRPGWGDYSGFMQVKALGADRYDVKYDLRYDAGNRVGGRGETIIYTGYEWRGTARLGNQDVRSVFALGADGNSMSGRWFLRNADEVGARFEAVRMETARPGTVVSLSPTLLKSGETTVVRVAGVKLGTDFDFGPGVKVDKAERVSPHEVRLAVSVAADAAPGWRNLGGSAAKVAVYRAIDSIRVEPPFAYARVGGGTNPPVSAQFEAVAYLDGPDGKPDTEDDVRLGPVRAQWSVDNYDERAKASEDARYAGVMEPHGQFLPSFAGPNPARNNLNNTGDLAVHAAVADGQRALAGKARLVVAPQRWNTPPLR
jgi:quinohemoprotein amine dehydrogenase